MNQIDTRKTKEPAACTANETLLSTVASVARYLSQLATDCPLSNKL